MDVIQIHTIASNDRPRDYALMLRACKIVDFRPTIAINLLGVTSNEEFKIVSQIE